VPRSFTEMVFDTLVLDYNERYVKRSADRQFDQVDGSVTSMQDQVITLQEVAERQNQKMLHMQAMVEGLLDVLHGKGSIDQAELERAVKSAWIRLTIPQQPPTRQVATDPYRGMPAAASTPSARCSKCGREVVAAQTNVSLDGDVVCDACS
jgi:hypothetical protein